jgi:hypothetical protein
MTNLSIFPLLALLGFFSSPHTDWRGDIAQKHASDLKCVDFYQFDWKLISKNQTGDWTYGVFVKIKARPSLFDDLLKKTNDHSPLTPIDSVWFNIKSKDGFIISTASRLFIKVRYDQLYEFRMEGEIEAKDIHRLDGASTSLDIRTSEFWSTLGEPKKGRVRFLED